MKRFRPRDLRDLQVWSNLAWMHPLLFEKDPELAEFKAKGRHYTEDEKQWLLDKQRELLARVVPLHRALAERGQIELTTTPYYHPILPLLLDKKLAREAMPDVALPAYREGYPEDAEIHVRRAVESHLRRLWDRRQGACGPARARSARRSSRCWPGTASSGSPPMRKFWAARPGARSGGIAAATCAIPSCCTVPGSCARAARTWRSSSATIPCRTRSAFTTSAVPGRTPRPIFWASCTPSATPAGTTRLLSSRSSWTARTAGNTIPTAACHFCDRSIKAWRVIPASGR